MINQLILSFILIIGSYLGFNKEAQAASPAMGEEEVFACLSGPRPSNGLLDILIAKAKKFSKYTDPNVLNNWIKTNNLSPFDNCMAKKQLSRLGPLDDNWKPTASPATTAKSTGKWVEIVTTNGCISRTFATSDQYKTIRREWVGPPCRRGEPISGQGLLKIEDGTAVITFEGKFVNGVMDGIQIRKSMAQDNPVTFNMGCPVNQKGCSPFTNDTYISDRVANSNMASIYSEEEQIKRMRSERAEEQARKEQEASQRKSDELAAALGTFVQNLANKSARTNSQPSQNRSSSTAVEASSNTAVLSTSSNSCRQKIIAIQTKGDADSRAAGGDAIVQARAMYIASAGQEALLSGECASDPQAQSYVSSARSAMRDWGSKCLQFGGDASCGGSSFAIAAAARTAAAQAAAQKPSAVTLYRDPLAQPDNEAFARRTNAARDCSRRAVTPQERGKSIDGWDCETPSAPAISAKLTHRQCIDEQSRIISMYPGDTPGRARAEMELFQGKCAHDQDAQTRLRQVKEYLAALNSRPTNSRPPSTGISGSNAPSIPDRFGALAIDRAHGDFYGWAVGFASQAEADSRVQDECSIKSTSCTNVMRFRNTCAAYAIDPVNNSTAYGWAYSAQRSNAESMALENCRQRGGDSAQCLIRVWGCTGG